jgi:hypothetical protein
MPSHGTCGRPTLILICTARSKDAFVPYMWERPTADQSSLRYRRGLTEYLRNQADQSIVFKPLDCWQVQCPPSAFLAGV